MVTYSIVVIILNSLLMPLPELEVCECTGDASKQIENFSASLNQTSGRVRELINKGKYLQAIPKSGRCRFQER